MGDDVVADEVVGAFHFDVVDPLDGETLDFFDAIPGGVPGTAANRDMLALGEIHDLCPFAITRLDFPILLAIISVTMTNRITINPDVRFGKPTIRGTRIAVADILNLLAAGYTLDEIPGQYPDITKEDALAAIEFATGILESPAKILARVAHG